MLSTWLVYQHRRQTISFHSMSVFKNTATEKLVGGLFILQANNGNQIIDCQSHQPLTNLHFSSEGEKVRVGDDLILVSVATERYLHTTKENDFSIVNASFHVTHWSVQPYGTGISRMKYVGYVFGGDVLRFFHGGDECLTIPSTWSRQPGQK